MMEEAIVKDRPEIDWDDIVGLDGVKIELRELSKEPGKYCKGILVFGPAGTGKSMLIKATAKEATSSTLIFTSAYSFRSESEVKTLFDTAVSHKPSLVYIEDVDALCESGCGEISELQAKSKAEFIAQMTERLGPNDGVLIIGDTNKTWRLHPDLSKVFERRMYVHLPDTASRSSLFKMQITGEAGFQNFTENNFRILAERSEGFSGADISVVVRDAMMTPIRKLQSATHYQRVKGPSPKDPTVTVDDLLAPCSPDTPGAVKMTWTEIPEDKILTPPVEMEDVLKALQNLKPSISEAEVKNFEEFNKEFGIYR